MHKQSQMAVKCCLMLFFSVGLGAIQCVQAQSWHEAVLHSFTGLGREGVWPAGPAVTTIKDKAGNTYGATFEGGAWGFGTIFKLDPKGKETIIYSLKGGTTDGALPNATLARDNSGNLYGTARSGGNDGFGVIFKVDEHGKETVLYQFTGQADGGIPLTGVIRDKKGNLYGTASYQASAYGGGTLYKLDNHGNFTVIYDFANPDDGSLILGLVRDAIGNLYVTSETGGPNQYFSNCIQTNWVRAFGCGNVAKIDPNGNETILHSFTGVDGDGGSPVGPVTFDAEGNLYGTTLLGGTGSCQPAWSSTAGCGTIFKIDTSGGYSVVYSFPGAGASGAGPVGAMIQDASGNFYGATEAGGVGTCGINNYNGGYYSQGQGCGLIFKVDTAGKETVLYRFRGNKDGGNPEAGLTEDSVGNLYGSTMDGGDKPCGFGHGCGTLFKLSR